MRRLIDLPEERWKELKLEAVRRGVSLKQLFLELTGPKGQTPLEATHFPKSVGVDSPAWTWEEPAVVPGKVGSDVPKVVPGPVRPSVTTPIVSVPSGSFGKSRPAPKGGVAKRRGQ